MRVGSTQVRVTRVDFVLDWGYMTTLKECGFEVEQKWGCELTKEMKEDEEIKQFFEEHEIVDPLQPRDAFYGGRTNAAKLFHQCQGNEKIK